MPVPVRRSDGFKLTPQQGDDHLDYVDTRSPRVVTMTAGGVITIDGPGVYQVETFGGAQAQNLTGITGGLGRQWPVILTLNTPGRVITVTHTPPNLMLDGSSDCILNSLNDSIELRDRTSVLWREMHRAGVP